MTLEGQTLGEFEILERLGQGGMGAVYKARQLSLKRLVALKTLQSAVAEDEDYIARFQQEAVAAAGLSHPNLVQVYSAGQSDGLHWFSMEYVEGESAKARLKREGRIHPLEAVGIAIHVATALQYGWRKASLIHRDVKPDNIFLSRDGEVKLGDLGLAKSAGDTKGLTTTGRSMGTPYYISPEQVQDMKTVDFRADIYSLGCTLFHLVGGNPPFDGSSGATIMLKHITEPVPTLQAAWLECPRVLSDVIEKMMQKDPADRQPDYETVLGDLRNVSAAVRDYETPTTADPAAKLQPQAIPAASSDLRVASPNEGDREAPTTPAPARKPRPQAVPAAYGDLRLAPAAKVDREAPTVPASQTAPQPPAVPTAQPASQSGAGAAVVPGTEVTPAKPATPRRSKMLILGEIIAALLVIVVPVYFFLMPNGKKAPKSETDDAADTADALNPHSFWRDWVIESRRNGYFLNHPDFTDNQAGITFTRRVAANSDVTFRNGKIRVRCTIPSPNLASQYVHFYVRMGLDPKGVLRRYEAFLTRDAVVFGTDDASQNLHELMRWSQPSTPDSPLSMVMEIEARKNSFTIYRDRKKLGTIQDDTIPDAGTFGVDGPAGTNLNGLLFINLDPPEPPASLPATK